MCIYNSYGQEDVVPVPLLGLYRPDSSSDLDMQSGVCECVWEREREREQEQE